MFLEFIHQCPTKSLFRHIFPNCHPHKVSMDRLLNIYVLYAYLYLKRGKILILPPIQSRAKFCSLGDNNALWGNACLDYKHFVGRGEWRELRKYLNGHLEDGKGYMRDRRKNTRCVGRRKKAEEGGGWQACVGPRRSKQLSWCRGQMGNKGKQSSKTCQLSGCTLGCNVSSGLQTVTNGSSLEGSELFKEWWLGC